MYLLYLDASGTPEINDTGSKNYVLLGVSIKEQTWHSLDEQLTLFKNKYRYNQTPFELHVKDINCLYSEQDQIEGFESLEWDERRRRVLALRSEKPKKDRKQVSLFKNTDPFIHLSRKERTQLIDDAVDLVSNASGIKLFCEAIRKNHPAFTEGQANPRVNTLNQVITRFDKFLKAIGKTHEYQRPKYQHQGLLVFDQEPSYESWVIEYVESLRKAGNEYGKIKNVIDTPFFAKSNQVTGLQIADLCAFVTRRYLDFCEDEKNTHNEPRFLKIFQLFDRDTNGYLHGIRHYVPQKTCQCLICRERKHGREG